MRQSHWVSIYATLAGVLYNLEYTVVEYTKLCKVCSAWFQFGHHDGMTFELMMALRAMVCLRARELKFEAWHIVASLFPGSLESLGTWLALYRSNALDSRDVAAFAHGPSPTDCG